MFVTLQPSSSSLSFAGPRISLPSTAAAALVRHSRPTSFVASYASVKAAKSSSSLYEVLGLTEGATNQEIRNAYRRLARVWHPDVVSKDRKDTSGDEFMKIHAAYSTLSDPEKRAHYDLTVLRPRQPSASAFTGYSRRTWETDQCW